MVGKTERLAEKIASTAWQSCRLPADRDKVLSIRAGPFSLAQIAAEGRSTRLNLY